ncbi:BglII/BstYI family type II restriction endonuclease [Fastidiosibacter lacustris]|uniref:BglII/BstYI family type II restriction endonuclease n=1 Tax=Fastidiosibacter lacustris TaxID=2056695 RepID=UPI000E34B611|nr:BglII/BstYI family type II restriction endonuclease [Fastidiosibacter lacustris]
MGINLLPEYVRRYYEIYEYKHACTILKEDFPNEWADIVSLLEAFRLKKSWIIQSGGRKSKVAEYIDNYLYAMGWVEKQFV